MPKNFPSSSSKLANEEGSQFSTALVQEIVGKFKNDDDSQDRDSPYQHLEKATVLQECRVFHDANEVTKNPRKCCVLITKLLSLLVKGDSFTSTEVTSVFFGVTKLFQSDDVNLRRMMYLFIKEVAETCNPDDVIIVTSSLTKDMTNGEDLYRANSMRVLAKIVDSTMLSAIERYLKQAIVDRNAFVASSALMAGLRLFDSCPDLVRRWINEVQEAVNSSSEMVQFHALSLLYKIKQHDRLAISKIVQTLSKGSLRSPLATCLLIRYTSKLLVNDPASPSAKSSIQFLENCLRHKNETVIFEAAKALCNLPGIESVELNSAITVLQLFLSSPKPALKFAAMRILSEVAVHDQNAVSKCNEDMENLVLDSNRSVATLAITTLLKTGSDSSIDNLKKQITSFMSDISDEFKIVIVKAIKEIYTKSPKHKSMLAFLATFLREEGGYEFKKSIVDSIVGMMLVNQEKEQSLLHLCEFIEDCEFSELIVQILHLIGDVGPTTSSPSRYIRFIFNRVILDCAPVRAAAVSSLGSFATRVPELRNSVITLLKRSLIDEDDEVRDRATFLLESFNVCVDENDLKFLLDESLPMSFTALERSIKAFSAHPLSADQILSLSTLPRIEDTATPIAFPTSKTSKKSIPSSSAVSQNQATSIPEVIDPAACIYNIPEFSRFGRAFKSCAETPLTETEMEYVVHCSKHIFDSHVILQFSVLNTIDDQRLKDVCVQIDINEPSYTVQSIVTAPVANYGEKVNCFVCIAREDPIPATINCQLQFKVIQVDPQTGEVEGDEAGYEEEYPLEAIELSSSDFMVKASLGDFRRSWDQIGTDCEVKEKFALSFKKLEDAIAAVIESLGMQPVDGTQAITAADGHKRSHTLHLSGIFVGNVPVLVRALLTLDESNTNQIVLMMAIRCASADVSKLVAECIR